MATLSDQYQDSFSEDDSQDDSYSDYSVKPKTTRKRASSAVKKTSTKIKVSKTPKRPGRKPIEDSLDEELSGDPKSKRKAQNRAAQRAFRERKEKHVSELQKRIRQLEEEKSTKETNLELENAKLKDELEKLRQENYSLQDSKFTFEYPRHHDATKETRPLDSPPLSSATPPTLEDYHSSSDHVQDLSPPPTSSSFSFNGNTSVSGSDTNSSSNAMTSANGNQPSSASEQNSPESLSSLSNDNSNSNNNNNNSINNNNNTYQFNAPPIANFGLFSDIDANHSFSPSQLPVNSDLFHGKTDFNFTDYRNPVAAEDDWLFHDGSDLPPLFGIDADRYGLPVGSNVSTVNQQSLPSDPALDQQLRLFYSDNADNNHNHGNDINNFIQHNINRLNNRNHHGNPLYAGNNNSTYNNGSLPNGGGYNIDPELTPSKARLIETVHLAKERKIPKVEVKLILAAAHPEFNISVLCEELRTKARCYDSTQPFDDEDITIIENCVKRC